MKKEQGDKLNPRYFVISGCERTDKGIIIMDESLRVCIKNAFEARDKKKFVPVRDWVRPKEEK